MSLFYLEPDVYSDLEQKIALRKIDREAFVSDIIDKVAQKVSDAGIDAQIDGRVKHFFSIYKKMKNQNKTLDQIYDLFAVRVLVEDIKGSVVDTEL